jgi:hypothetical protein
MAHPVVAAAGYRKNPPVTIDPDEDPTPAEAPNLPAFNFRITDELNRGHHRLKTAGGPSRVLPA